MGQMMCVRGVPQVLRRDAWWLDATGPAGPASGLPPASPPGTPPVASGGDATSPSRSAPPTLALVLLVALADGLFWGHDLGVSVVLFAAALFVVVCYGVPMDRVWRPAVLLVLGALPALVYVQPLSVMILVCALVAALVWVRGLPQSVAQAGAQVLGWLWRVPLGWADLCDRLAETLSPQALRRGAAQLGGGTLLRDWGLPVGGLLILAALLLQANPVLAQALNWEPDLLALIERGLFWSGVAVVLWPMIRREAPEAVVLPTADAGRWLGWLGVNRGSVVRALAVFNAALAVQTLLDVSILLGGAALPEGMTYAEYAHRGAYPLLATALLAGVFALAARPFLLEHRAVRPLLLVWLVQNVALCGSAMLRTDLYVAAYGMTHLRFAAFVWMGLVAALLALAVWQVIRARSNGWLIWRGAALSAMVLYAVSLVNVTDLVARQNLAGLRDVAALTERVVPVDYRHLCDLGPSALPALYDALEVRPDLVKVLRGNRCDLVAPTVESWQDWGLRKARLSRYGRLQQSTPATEPAT